MRGERRRITVLEEISSKMDKLINQQDGIINAFKGFETVVQELKVDKGIESRAFIASDVEPVTEDPTPHLTIGMKYIGIHEEDESGDLINFLGMDPDLKAWCGYYACACLESCGFEVPEDEYKGVAKSYAGLNYKKVIGPPNIGDLMVWKNHVGFFVGYCDEQVKFVSKEDWVEGANLSEGSYAMVLGGNQSDMVNISPAEWYDNYSDFIGYFKVC